MMRAGVVLFALVAGMGAGAAVFKIVAEEKIGGEVKILTSRLGIVARPGDTSALDLVERLAPGTASGFQSAAIQTVVASLLVAVVVSLAVREITS